MSTRMRVSPAGAWLDAHQGEVFTTAQFAAGTGITEHLAAVILREATDRGWVGQVPDGWRTS